MIYFVATGLPECMAGKPVVLSVKRGTFRPYGEAPPNPVRYGFATPGTPKLPTLKLALDGAWHDRLRRDLQAPPGRILLYVHGYNNSPVFALSTADQLASAAGFDGPVVAFLWPSQHSLEKYPWDEENARWAQSYFDAVLTDLAAQAPEVVLIAHSMGTRIAIDGLRHLDAIRQVPGAPDLAARVKTVVLAAPDIDREAFDRDFSTAIVQPGRRVALFASTEDVPLRTSWGVHGNPRAGDLGCIFRPRRTKAGDQSRCYPLVRGAPGEMTVIDGSDVQRAPAGHSIHIQTPEGRKALRQFLATPPTLPAGTNGVLVLQPEAAPECASGLSRLKLAFQAPCGASRRKGND